jgi:hypothetical protein
MDHITFLVAVVIVTALAWTDTRFAPWTVVKSNDKKRARVEAMRTVLDRFDYTGEDEEVVGTPDPRIVGEAAGLLEAGEVWGPCPRGGPVPEHTGSERA